MFPFPAYEEKNAVPGKAKVPPYYPYQKKVDPFDGRAKASMAGSVIWVPKDPTVDLKTHDATVYFHRLGPTDFSERAAEWQRRTRDSLLPTCQEKRPAPMTNAPRDL